MVETLASWVRQESPSRAADAVNAMQDRIVAEASAAPVRVERIAGREGLGDCVLLHAGPATDRPSTLVITHVDTVHPIGTAETSSPVRRDGDRLYGPGAYDMKGGVYIALMAFLDVARRDAAERPLTLLLSPDEEIGSPTTRALIEDLARKAGHALVMEPARPGGAVVTARKGVGWFDVAVRGRPAHAGSRHQDGRSAIREAARQILRVEEMTDYARGTTATVGLVSGGTAANVVPHECSFSVDLRVTDVRDGERLAAAIGALEPVDPDVALTISGGINRPPYQRTAAVAALLAVARAEAAALGFELPEVPMTGGGSDGNFTAALGVPTLDGLGVDGDGAHTLEEYCLISSIAPRQRLLTRLLETL
jgi:glutamate carboxypeptidase